MFVYLQLYSFLLCLISPQDIFLMHDKNKTQRLEYQEVMPSLKAAGSIHNTFSSCVVWPLRVSIVQEKSDQQRETNTFSSVFLLAWF